MSLESDLARFERVCGTWIRALDDYEEIEWRRPPAPGTWSISQVYAHILEVATLSLSQLEKCIEREYGKPRKTLAGHLVFLLGGLPPMRIRAPKTLSSAPSQPESKETVRGGLTEAIERMRRLIAAVPSARGVSTHPILGKLTAREWFAFMAMHMQHHLRQKKRIDRLLVKSRGQ